MKTSHIAVALAATFPARVADGGDDALDVGKMFQARCANCHTVPDRKIRTDLAWLDQVNRTS